MKNLPKLWCHHHHASYRAFGLLSFSWPESLRTRLPSWQCPLSLQLFCSSSVAIFQWCESDIALGYFIFPLTLIYLFNWRLRLISKERKGCIFVFEALSKLLHFPRPVASWWPCHQLAATLMDFITVTGKWGRSVEVWIYHCSHMHRWTSGVHLE